MAAAAGPDIVTNGLVLSFDPANTKSFPGEPTVNYVTDAATMTGWNSYDNGNDGTFITEFGTTGYKMYNRGSWNGVYKGVSLPSTGTYIISAYFRYLGGASANNGGVVYTSGGGIGDTAAGHSKAIGEWVRVSATRTFSTTSFTFYLISYGGTYGGDYSSWEVTMPQVELKSSYPTNFANGTRGATVATGGGLRDTSGKGNHGALINGPLSPGSYSKGVLAFDGTNDYVEIPTFNSAPSTQITCEAWINPSRTVSTGTVRGGVISNTNSMYLGIFNSADGGSTHGMHWANMTTGGRPYNVNGSIPNNTWTLLTGTYDGSTSRAYIDGVEVWSEGQSGTIPAGTYVVGTYGPTLTDVTHNFQGLIGDARIYNRALTASEVLENYNKSKAKYKTL
jgi:hypothetical protein